jgi:hypothetical protein
MTAETGASQKHPSKDHPERKPLDPRSDNPSENSRLHAATTIQSEVTPEDYPEEKRDLQVAAATDGKLKGKPKPKP